jgi:hypothetical protein
MQGPTILICTHNNADFPERVLASINATKRSVYVGKNTDGKNVYIRPD